MFDKAALQRDSLRLWGLGGCLGQRDVSGKKVPPPPLLSSFSENEFYLFNFMEEQNREIVLTNSVALM